MSAETYPFETLPDLIQPGLDVGCLGLNPSRYSLARGHDVAGPANRCWPARAGLGPRPAAAGPREADYRAWSPRLLARRERHLPRVACLPGMTAYRACARCIEIGPPPEALGPRGLTLGESKVFVAPNPSPANARFRLERSPGRSARDA